MVLDIYQPGCHLANPNTAKIQFNLASALAKSIQNLVFVEHHFLGLPFIGIKIEMTSKVPFQLFGPYADRNRWEVLNGPGDSRVTGYQIIQDEGLVNKWNDKVILITGVSSGIGAETVRVLAQTGATVYGTVRNMDKAREALGDLLDAGRVKLLFMDQTDLSSVRACAREFLGQSAKLNIMINNAAVSFTNSIRYQRHGRITLTIRST